MRWRAKPFVDLWQWHRWYAWYPVRVENEWVWREWVERRLDDSHLCSIDGFDLGGGPYYRWPRAGQAQEER